jgi:hypothetical protein
MTVAAFESALRTAVAVLNLRHLDVDGLSPLVESSEQGGAFHRPVGL